MTEGRSRRNFVLGSLLGALPAFVVFGWLITVGNGDLFPARAFGTDFYDAQAQALMHGHWDMPGSVLSIDGFQVGSKYHMYFGIWPSILRMPVLAFSDSLSGRLSVVSMLLAYGVLMGGASALFWRIRTLARPESGCSPAEALVAAAVVFTIGCGSTALYLASQAFVYHEAILWAVAWSLLAYERIVAFAQRPTRARLAAAALFTTLTILSRVSVGIGPVVALALLAAIELVRVIADRRAPEDGPPRSSPLLERLGHAGVREEGSRHWFLPATAAVLVPVAAYMWMNFSRFGSLFGIPWRDQVIAQLSPAHRAMLDANGGSLFGIKLIPTTLVQAVRPDALGWSPVFPWVTFQRFPTPVFGDAVFNELEFTSSVTASMAALVLLGLVGLAAVIWTRLGPSPELARLRAPLVGAAASPAIALAFTYVAARYLGDWIPILALAGLAGLEVLLARRRAARKRFRWNALLALVAVLAVFGVWVNFSLGLVNQRLYARANASLQSEMLSFQYRVSHFLGTGTPDLVISPRLPSGRAPAGKTWIVGECRALYWSDGRVWVPVEGTPSEGRLRVRADFRDVGSEWSALVGFGFPGRQDVIGVKRDLGGIRFALGQPDSNGELVWTAGFSSVRIPPGPKVVRIVVDRVNDSLIVKANNQYPLAFSAEPTNPPPREIVPGPASIGRVSTGGIAPFPGPVALLHSPTRACDKLAELHG